MDDLLQRAANTQAHIIDLNRENDDNTFRLLADALYGKDMGEFLLSRFGRMNHALDVLK